MLKEMFEYIKDSKIRIIIEDKKINIYNYKKILLFEDNHILIDIGNKILDIKGKNLGVRQLYKQDLIIAGIINCITFRGNDD